MLVHNLGIFQKKLSKNHSGLPVHIFSFSITPDHDVPARLKEYSEMHKIDLSNWAFLTGQREEIYRVGKEVFQDDRSVGAKNKDDVFIHSDNVYLVDFHRRIRGIYSTSSAKDMRDLMSDIIKLNSGA